MNLLIERENEFCEIIRRRMNRPWPAPQWVHARRGTPLMTDPIKARNGKGKQP